MYDIPKCGEVVSIVPTPPHFSRVVDWWPNRQVLVWARTLADATRWTKPTMAVQLPKPRVTRRSVSDGILKFLINMVFTRQKHPNANLTENYSGVLLLQPGRFVAKTLKRQKRNNTGDRETELGKCAEFLSSEGILHLQIRYDSLDMFGR